MARSDPQFNIRMPEKLKQQIDEAAAKSNRSMTSEVIARLQTSFEEPEHLFEKIDHYQEQAFKMTALVSQLTEKLEESERQRHEAMKQWYAQSNLTGLDAMKREILEEIRKLKDTDA